MKNNYIIDFDSTFTQVEALDELARISLKKHPQKEEIFKQIEALTNAAMDGKLSFTESLAERIKLLQANQTHLDELIRKLRRKVSSSFSRNKNFFKTHYQEVYIFSGGFKEFIVPVVSQYGIKAEHVFANTFKVDKRANIIGYDTKNPLSEEGGKVKLLKILQLEGNIYVIGDGYSDYQLQESGLIKQFFAFTENIERASVIANANLVAPSFDEFLFVNKLPMAISYPKNRIKCLVLGDVEENSLKILKKEGYNIRVKTEAEEKYIQDAGILIAANGTKITNAFIEKASKLKVIAYLGNGTKKIDLEKCTEMGIVVFDDKKQNPRKANYLPKRLIDFINKGDTYLSTNFPNLQLQPQENAHRLIHIHHNIPGIMAQINQVFAKHELNILAQYLKTNAKIGYVITDVNAEYDKKILDELKKIKHTIKFRLLY